MKWIPFALATVVAALLTFAYSNTLRAPFVFDDNAAILDNPSIRDLSRLKEVLNPPSTTGVTVNGRPLVNLSLAINRHFSGTDERAYHLTNIFLHLATAALLFSVFRSLMGRSDPGPWREADAVLADSAAVLLSGLWALHPLQTAAVTYTVQRAEVLVSLFACAATFAFLRFERATREGEVREPVKAGLWSALSVAACLAGMATKEVMAAVPALILLLDSTLNRRSLLASLRSRPVYYACLAATWLLLAWLVLQGAGRGGTAGPGTGISPSAYFLTQLYAVPHYLRLAVWPSPLIFDYGGEVLVSDFARILPGAVALALMACGAIWGLRRRKLAGFALAAFFGLLAPSSSIVPLADTMFEHRIYLPLAAVLGAVACVVPSKWRKGAVYLGVCLLPFLAFSTWKRNAVYRDERTLWEDVVAKAPDNVRAHSTLGVILFGAGEQDRSVSEYETALRLDPADVDTRVNFGAALARMGRLDQAESQLAEALRLAPNSAFAHNNQAAVLAALGRREEAVTHLERALAQGDDSADLRNNFGSLLASLGRMAQAEEQLRTAIRLNNRYAEAHANLANVLAKTGRLEEAVKHYTAAITLRPGFVEAWYDRGSTFVMMARYEEARADYETALRLKPDHANAREMIRRLDARR